MDELSNGVPFSPRVAYTSKPFSWRISLVSTTLDALRSNNVAM